MGHRKEQWPIRARDGPQVGQWEIGPEKRNYSKGGGRNTKKQPFCWHGKECYNSKEVMCTNPAFLEVTDLFGRFGEKAQVPST
jgi:hypothetical protein